MQSIDRKDIIVIHTERDSHIFAEKMDNGVNYDNVGVTSGYGSTSDANATFDSTLGDLSTNRDSPNSRSSTLILDNSETEEEENSDAESPGTELLDEPKYVSASTSSLSQPHIFNSCQPACQCMRCIIYNSQLLPFRLPKAYHQQENNSNTCKDTRLALSLQYTFNLSQQSSEPEDNPMEALDYDPPWNPIYAIDPINDVDVDSEREVGDDTAYSPSDSPYSPCDSPDSSLKSSN